MSLIGSYMPAVSFMYKHLLTVNCYIEGTKVSTQFLLKINRRNVGTFKNMSPLLKFQYLIFFKANWTGLNTVLYLTVWIL